MLARPNTPLYDTLEAGRPFSIRSYEYELVSACDAEVLFVWVGDSTGLPLHFFRFFFAVRPSRGLLAVAASASQLSSPQTLPDSLRAV